MCGRRAATSVRPAGARSLPDGLPIASLIGDSHAALFGQAAFGPGTVKATYGTGSSLMTVTRAPIRSAHGLSTTVAWALPGGASYALEGNITMTGGAIDWFGQFLGGANTAATVVDLAATAEDAGGVYLVPAFAGLGAPHWDDRARGLICGAHARLHSRSCGEGDTRVDCVSGARCLRRDARGHRSRAGRRSWRTAAPAGTTR